MILTQPIYIGVHEVTQSDYEKVMGRNPSYFAATGGGKEAIAGLETTGHPVEQVTWNDAAEFCEKLSQKEKLKPFYFRSAKTETAALLSGNGYRLPTEAECEFATHSGATTRFWIGDTDKELATSDWFAGNSGGRTHNVGELRANPYGLYDLHGNVWEWVKDYWEQDYYKTSEFEPPINPNGPSAGSQRVYRGGSWNYPASDARGSFRAFSDPAKHNIYTGFRVALSADAVKEFLKREQTSASAAQTSPTFENPEFMLWQKSVAELPAEKQVKAVAMKLAELNPGFDGTAKWRIEDQVVKMLKIPTESVSNITPVQALKGLTELQVFAGSPGTGRLSDLSPVRGLKLTKLHCDRNPQITDLSPLKGMPLVTLQCDHTAVSDLSSLVGSPLEYLNCNYTPLHDLTPLSGLPLTSLYCCYTCFEELSPLRDTQLLTLAIEGTKVTELSPIQHCPLSNLWCGNTRIANLALLQGDETDVSEDRGDADF